MKKEKPVIETHSKQEAPPGSYLNPDWQVFVRRESPPSYAILADKVLQGDRVALSQAITLVESSLPKHAEQAEQLIDHCLPFSGNALRIGITGAPGSGKSTFIEALGQHLIALGHQVAVLAIDPSSKVSKGSILGDKTRMQELATSPHAFIRPSPAGQSLGGVARTTREAIILCEAAGFDVILVETVGVGQSEFAAYEMVDLFLLLLIPGAGDELQGIKRGIVEMADLLLVNKADGDNRLRAQLAQKAYQNAVHLLPPKENGCTPEVHCCSALQQEGIREAWERLQFMANQLKASGYFQARRSTQSRYWMHEAISEQLHQLFYSFPGMEQHLKHMEEEVVQGKINPFHAAQRLLSLFLQENGHFRR